MRDVRRLGLKREALSPLSTDELTVVVGGSHACTVGHGPSFDQACPTPTLPVNDCGRDITSAIDLSGVLCQ